MSSLRSAAALATLLLLLSHCSPRPRPYDFPQPVDTSTRPIALQEKRSVDFPALGLSFDNEFDGARMNEVNGVEGPTFEVMIGPENEPINPSPWYAFRVTPSQDRRINVHVNLGGARQRYWPKLSTDFVNWVRADTAAVRYNADTTGFYLDLELRAGRPVYVAAQEVMNSAFVGAWARELGRRHPAVAHYREVGPSRLGRPLPVLDLYRATKPPGRRTETIVLLSRQHPPEVTGFVALQGFLDQLLDHELTPAFLTRYRVLVYPLLNPDGVDLGHWRHNAGGIDLNRDWAYYRQPETRAVSEDVVTATGGNVILGLDFHSTWFDVYYTHEPSVPTRLPGFQDAWLAGIEAAIGDDFRINEDPGVIGRPTSAGWFATQFGAEGITYEIGDRTPRDFVRRKGAVSAAVLLELLLERED